MPEEKLIEAVAVKSFTSTQFGTLAQGDKLNLTQARFNVWKEQGLVDAPDAVVPAGTVSEMPEPVKAAPKKPGKRKGKNRK